MASSAGQKRITKLTFAEDLGIPLQEFGECTTNPGPGIKVQLTNESSMYKWDIYMEGPEQSPFAGGHFKLLLTLPAEYPFKPPVINFQTKIYHPNVSNDDKGSMCLGMLRSDEWKPPNRIAAVLDMVRNILIEPNTDDAVETSVADQYKNNRKEFEKTAKDWVKRYASKK